MADTEFADSAVVTWHIELQAEAVTSDGPQWTNAAVLMVDPATPQVTDESGMHAGRRFVPVSLQREELVDILAGLESDWLHHCRGADPMADPRPLLTPQASARVRVLLQLLQRADEVLATVEGGEPDEANQLAELRGQISSAVDSWTLG